MEIVNTGRGVGLISRVVVVEAAMTVVPAKVEGFSGGEFIPTQLPGQSAMTLVMTVVEGKSFGDDVQVKVAWGDEERFLPPQFQDDVGYAGMKSSLPPRG